MNDQIETLEEELLEGDEAAELDEAETGEEADAEQSQAEESSSFPGESTGDVTQIYLNEIGHSPLLKPDEERALARRVVQGDFEARQKMIEHNLRLVVYIARRFENTGINIEDLISIGTIGLIKAVNTYRSDKNIKLATYASRCIENEILMFLRRSSRTKSEVSFDEPLNTDWDGNELLLMDVLTSDQAQVGEELERNAERSALLAAVQALNPRERQIMELRFGLRDGVEHTQKEVADFIGISQSYISRLEKRIIKRLRQQIESLV